MKVINETNSNMVESGNVEAGQVVQYNDSYLICTDYARGNVKKYVFLSEPTAGHTIYLDDAVLVAPINAQLILREV